jgi:hypothetical protein|tara:strand:+ start:2699 stop:3346 length:648 start_codon:yes stop_codon:yes gene_type:complete
MTMTYGELKTAIQDYTENDETTFVNNLPLFIRLAEERILKSVQLNLFQKNQAGTMTSGNQYLAAPSDFLAPFSLSIDVSGAAEFLLFKDLDFVQTYTPDPTTTGQPKYYAQFDVDNFILAPTPNANFTVDIHYLYRPASLTAGADSGTSWLSTNAEIALLYGSLVEAYTYMKGDMNLMQMYMQRYGEAVSRLKNLGEAQETIDEYRYGSIRIPRS